ncbi:hypothetical protein RMATCC62417_02233 [Rhizopus microsporus]|nr:hypothetical protein RMATCC62417_02233 [Rhizopus microsporus]
MNMNKTLGNYPKKPNTERRDSSTYKQQRKTPNVKKDNKIVPNKAAGAAILSAVTSPPSPSVIQQQQQQQQQNGINTNELVEFLNMRFSDVLTAYHDTNLDASLRPEKYESQEKAWAKPVWGQQQQQQKPGVMANGLDFLTEITHQIK